MSTNPLKIDIGCGPNPREGYEGVDQIKFPNVKHVLDVGNDRWPFKDGSVEAAYSRHFLEHLEQPERVFFLNELYRVLVPGGKFEFIVPNWASNTAYGDPTHKWPPYTPFAFWYWSKPWRMSNAPHTDTEYNETGLTCDFEVTYAGVGNAAVTQNRAEGWTQYAAQYYIDVVQELHGTATKLPRPTGTTGLEGISQGAGVAGIGSPAGDNPKTRGNSVRTKATKHNRRVFKRP